VVPRQLRELLTVFPPAPALKQYSPFAENGKLFPRARPSPSTDELHEAILVALCLAEAAGQLFILNARPVWELMNQPLARSSQARSLDVASLCKYPAQRRDTS
jgi:hypothetical protein